MSTASILLALLGFATMIVITVLLLKKKISILLAFTTIPLAAGILAMLIQHAEWFTSLPGITTAANTYGKWVAAGIDKTWSITLMMFFSLPYFLLMSDTGMFDDIVKAVMRRVPVTAPIICALTVLVACIVELDGSITSVFLITVPLMLPLYEKFRVRKELLPFLISIAILIMCNTPWNPKILRATSLLPKGAGNSMTLFLKILPVQAFMLVALLAYAVIYGVLSQRSKLTAGSAASTQTTHVSREELLAQFKDTELTRHNMFWFNMALTMVLFVCMIVFDKLPQYYIFATGLTIALAVNYKDLSAQTKLLKKYGQSLWPVAPAVLLSGVVVGVMQESGMLTEMVNAMVMIVPSAIGPYFYLIIALLSTPLMLLFTNDTWFYALIPLVSAFSAKYGVDQTVVIATLFMNFGSMISVIAQPQLYIATDLTGISIDKHIKFTLPRMWIFNVLVVVVGFAIGVFR
ncbi:citrate transporter [Alloscardovia macacae]|uniref:Citrate transporter n=1 Tax=Alloscardovia macacae TaxID=1160091 RepID=A0A1Y2SV15_9BIFI|nr:SLC13 family permease [Alloscardovia macacae]OTA26933.1 citrate transporter [Alloscardovia macacae]OTA30078.1 citrate transporter [Alloscardovia macacae]